MFSIGVVSGMAEAKDNPKDWGGEEGDNEGPGGDGEKWQDTPWFCEICDVPSPPRIHGYLAFWKQAPPPPRAPIGS